MGIADKIAQAEARLKQLKALKQKQAARERAKLSKQERTADTRRKILAGSLILDMMEKNPDTKANMMQRLDKHLTRKDDRALFGFEPLPEQQKEGGVNGLAG